MMRSLGEVPVQNSLNAPVRVLAWGIRTDVCFVGSRFIDITQVKGLKQCTFFFDFGVKMTIFLSFMLACSEKSTDSAEDTAQIETPTTGGFALRFSIDEDYAAIMDEPPTGIFYGSFWHGEDVAELGPIEGREAISVMEIQLDLPMDGSETEILWTEEDLMIEEVYVLGFLDSDANSDPEDTGPDSKDPVTLPGDNDFDVVGGQITEISVTMSMLYP
jgi:hypothetical protein